MPLLQLTNVSKVYRPDSYPIHALKKANFTVKKGEFVAIMGASGSGKSTLMHIAGLLDTPTSGKVMFEGRNVSRLSETQLASIRNKKIGFVFQTFNLIPRTSALENVMLPLLYDQLAHQAMRNKATKVLKAVSLEKRISHLPNQLSGGEQQRVAIARALVNNPSLILADEPTGNLDTKSGIEIMEILKKLNQKGHTIIVVTHEPEIAEFAQRTVKIKDGEIIH